MDGYSILIGLLACLLVILIIIISWLCYMGLFKKMKVITKEFPEMTIFNMNYTGSMQDTYDGYLDMEKKAKELIPNLPLLPTMGGVYYTSPSSVENPKDNKWSSFFILDDAPDILELAKELPESKLYKVITIPKCKVLYTSFPYRNPLSYMLGPMKAYGAIQRVMDKNNIKPVGCIELYHNNGEPIDYIMYLEREDIFKSLQETSFTAINKT